MDTMMYAAEDRVEAKAPVVPELGAASDELSRLGKLIAETRANLNNFIERAVIGDAPQAAENGPKERVRRHFNCGSTGQLRRTIEELTEIAQDGLRLSERLREIS